jgi:hypothetical protein
MSSYRGQRQKDGTARVTVNGDPLPLEGFHSPTGFEWGYLGSGPAELARALMRHHLGDRIPHPFIYQGVKEAVVSRLGHDAWELTSVALETAMQRILLARGRTCPLCADSGYRQLPGRREDACECAVGRRLFNEPIHVSHHPSAQK